MNALVILIQSPCIDFSKLLGTGHEMFGRSISASSDASHKQLNDTERFLSCLASMRDQNAPVTLPPHLLSHVSFSVLVATSERDMLDVLECCASMPFTAADTLARGIQAAVISGTLSQWKTAVLSGCGYSTEASVRFLFNKILAIFEAANLYVWQEFTRKTHRDDDTLYLEGPR